MDVSFFFFLFSFFFIYLFIYLFFQGERPTRGREEEGYFHGYTSNNRGIHRAA